MFVALPREQAPVAFDARGLVRLMHDLAIPAQEESQTCGTPASRTNGPVRARPAGAAAPSRPPHPPRRDHDGHQPEGDRLAGAGHCRSSRSIRAAWPRAAAPSRGRSRPARGEAGLGELGGVRPVPCKLRAHVPASTRGWWRCNESMYASSSCTQNRRDPPCVCCTGRGNCEAGFERKRLTVLGEIPHRAAAAFKPMSRRSGSVPAPFVAVVCLRFDFVSFIVNSLPFVPVERASIYRAPSVVIAFRE